MGRYKKIIVLTTAVLAMAAAFLVIKAQQEKCSSCARRETLDERLAQLPITDFVVDEPRDLEKRRLRQTRNARHDSFVSPNGIRAPVLNEGVEPVLLDLPLSHQPEEPAIPISKSDVVVTAIITDVKAYISSDKTRVYSEATITVRALN
jgi:hypothetical protein